MKKKCRETLCGRRITVRSNLILSSTKADAIIFTMKGAKVIRRQQSSTRVMERNVKTALANSRASFWTAMEGTRKNGDKGNREGAFGKELLKRSGYSESNKKGISRGCSAEIVSNYHVADITQYAACKRCSTNNTSRPGNFMWLHGKYLQ